MAHVPEDLSLLNPASALIGGAASLLLSRGGSSMSDAAPPSEGVTLTFLLGGFLAIVWFLASEFVYLKDKTATMVEAASKKGGRSSKDFTWADLVDYRLDYFFSTSEWANVILLLGLSYLLVVFGAGLLVIADSDDYATLSEAAWTSWTYVVDPGAQADAPSELVPRTVSLIVTLGGLLVFALLIGIVGESIGEKLEDLKTGKSRVFESGHTLMLNWNDKSLAVIRQIALANESEGGGTMVVLSQLEKEDMEERLSSAINAKEDPLDLLGTDVVFRQGNPILENDLKKVSASTARSVIALTPPDFDSDEADANMLRQVRRPFAFSLHYLRSRVPNLTSLLLCLRPAGACAQGPGQRLRQEREQPAHCRGAPGRGQLRPDSDGRPGRRRGHCESRHDRTADASVRSDSGACVRSG